MRTSGHDEFDGFAVGWALHALEPAEEQAFSGHLVTCDRCRQLVRESEDSLGELTYNLPMFEPPPELLENIRQATGASDGGLRVEHSAPPVLELRRRARWAPARTIAAVAAAAAVLALLGWNVALQGRVDQAERLAAQRQDTIVDLASSSTRATLTDAANRTVGYVLQRGPNVEIVAGGIAPNDRSATTYVLWAVQGSGEPPQAVGTFDVIGTAMAVRKVDGRAPTAGTFSGFAVSKERGREVPQRPSQVIATGAVPS